MNDTQRITWLEDTYHVLCYDDGEWFCAWRDKDGTHWLDCPGADCIRTAIDNAVESQKKETVND